MPKPNVITLLFAGANLCPFDPNKLFNATMIFLNPPTQLQAVEIVYFFRSSLNQLVAQ